MKNFHLVTVLCVLSPLAAACQAPTPPPAPDTTVDEGIIDVFQGPSRRAVESFKILRKADGSIEFHGEVTLALPDGNGGSDKWVFYPNVVYGERGLKRYDLRAKYPTGPGSTSVKLEGGKFTWQFAGPNNQKVGPEEVPLPLNGLILDKRVLAHYAYFGLIPGEKSRPTLDPDTARVAEARISPPVPARIETPLGSFLCERVLITIGAFGANLWFNPDGFLLRIEIPHFGIVGVRRSCYGFPGPRALEESIVADVAQDFQVQDGRAMIAGSLYVPEGKGPFNAVLILGDSGPQDRKGNPPGDTLFWNHHRDWSRAFQKAGVAALSPDDPGTGYSVSGNENESLSDAVLHARAVIAWARTQPALAGGKIGVLGHGEGSLVALQLAVNGDADFAVLVGAHGMGIGDLFLAQSEFEMKRQGVPKGVMEGKLAEDRELQRLWLDTKIDLWKAPAVPEKFEMMGGPRAWFREISSYKTIELAARVKVPVMVVHGEADLQVPLSNGEALAKALADAKKDATFRKFGGLDHFLMPVINGDSGDSADPDRRVDAGAADEMGKWMKSR